MCPSFSGFQFIKNFVKHVRLPVRLLPSPQSSKTSNLNSQTLTNIANRATMPPPPANPAPCTCLQLDAQLF